MVRGLKPAEARVWGKAWVLKRKAGSVVVRGVSQGRKPAWAKDRVKVRANKGRAWVNAASAAVKDRWLAGKAAARRACDPGWVKVWAKVWVRGASAAAKGGLAEAKAGRVKAWDKAGDKALVRGWASAVLAAVRGRWLGALAVASRVRLRAKVWAKVWASAASVAVWVRGRVRGAPVRGRWLVASAADPAGSRASPR